MARNITTGIDIGTYQIKVVITEYGNSNNGNLPKIIGTGFSQSKGLRHGYIINPTDTIRAIKIAVAQAEKSAKVRIKKAFISIGGVGLEEAHSKGGVIISRADSEITDLDIEKALKDSEKKIEQKILNRKVLHDIPLRYKIDGGTVLGKPQGMKGSRLEVDVLFVTCLEQHLNDLIAAVEEAGVQVEDVMASPIAGSFVTLSRAQKVAGAVLANIGAETVSIVVFENNIPISLKVFSIGGSDITNDIALGLKIPLEDAEKVKTGMLSGVEFPKKKLDEIITARLSDIFELIETHLKKIGKNGLLPAGIIITGGGSGIATIEDLARASLKLPSKLANGGFGKSQVIEKMHRQVRDSSWAVAYGLCIWGTGAEEDPVGVKIIKESGGNIWQWIKQFLP
ncbi:MAG: cell division protein FtsA [Candidatus Pacebacteria bacterium]|jgi:cell division protein FtsA|nr:cell division protein FtsA [Parcubacteria group bacterium]MDP6249299.1 cell division protein FtsA [Candidatus Paceibacterota bacterium]MDP7159407.1 cell division protein FtsA [Candidatus Paceibacterota bacterium]MDP7367221.1 cell division protein FtsA [Candidatus Paceibacterota bacterium]MDP7466480.1 cell division protein FtsA [Candidatus Paceibacterota bacterium]|tara:strand:+ start:9956 stop:11143 length:1188 start_codon:yes stop_codon:yes gene_type:complete